MFLFCQSWYYLQPHCRSQISDTQQHPNHPHPLTDSHSSSAPLWGIDCVNLISHFNLIWGRWGGGGVCVIKWYFKARSGDKMCLNSCLCISADTSLCESSLPSARDLHIPVVAPHVSHATARPLRPLLLLPLKIIMTWHGDLVSLKSNKSKQWDQSASPLTLTKLNPKSHSLRQFYKLEICS